MIYLIESRLADGTLVDTIAFAKGGEMLDSLMAELEQERAEDTQGGIVGNLVITPLTLREALMLNGHQIPERWGNGDVASYAEATGALADLGLA